MFFHNFTQAQKIAFLALAKKIVEADGIITNEERAYLTYIQQEDMNFNANVVIPDMSIQQIAKEFDKAHNRIWLFLEMIGVANIDEEIAPEEHKIIAEVAQIFKLKVHTVQELINIVLQHKKNQNVINSIIKDYYHTAG